MRLIFYLAILLTTFNLRGSGDGPPPSPRIFERTTENSNKPILHRGIHYSENDLKELFEDMVERFGKYDPVLIVLRKSDPIGFVAPIIENASQHGMTVYTVLVDDRDLGVHAISFSEIDISSHEWVDNMLRFPFPKPNNESKDIN